MGFLLILGIGISVVVCLTILCFICLCLFGSGWNAVETIFSTFVFFIVLTIVGTGVCEVLHIAGVIKTNDVLKFVRRGTERIPKPEPEKILEKESEPADAERVINREALLSQREKALVEREAELFRREAELKNPLKEPKKPSETWKWLTSPVGTK